MSVPIDRPRSSPTRSRSGTGGQRDRRSRILDAALDAFGSQGFEYTSVESLCVLAGVTPRHFDLEFDSREAVLVELYDRCSDSVHRRMVDFLAGLPDEMDPTDLARAGVTELLHALLDDPRIGRVVCVEPAGVDRRIEQRASAGLDLFAELIEAQLDRLARGGRIPERPYRLQSIALAGAVCTLAFRALVWDDPPSIEQLADELAGVLSAFVEGIGVAVERSEAPGSEETK